MTISKLQTGCVQSWATEMISARGTSKFVSAILVISFLAVATFSHPANADDPVPPPAVASNQSVSLNEEQPRTPDASAETSTKPATPESVLAGPSLTTDAEPTADPPRAIRRGRTAPISPNVPVSEPVAWYRSAVGATAIVLGAIVVLFLALRKFMPTVVAADQRTLTVVARAALGPKHTVALIQLPRRFLLVGVGPESVSVLSEISDPTETADLAATVLAGRGNNHRRFEEVLTREHHGFESADDADRETIPELVGRSGRPAALGDLLRRVRGLQGRQERTRAAS